MRIEIEETRRLFVSLWCIQKLIAVIAAQAKIAVKCQGVSEKK